MRNYQAFWLQTMVFVVAVFSSNAADACRCKPNSHYPDVLVTMAVASADVVFIGEAMPGGAEAPRQGAKLIFKANRWWKGPDHRPETVTFDLSGTLCDIWFEPGQVAVIYGFGPNENGNYSSTTCALMTRTQGVEDESAILDSLDLSDVDDWETDHFTYGCGGGIAATYTMTTIYRDGRMSTMTRSVIRSSSNEIKQLPSNPELADEVFVELESIDFRAVGAVNVPGNYTCSYEVGLGAEQFRATWSGGNAGLPDALEELGRKVRAYGAHSIVGP